MTRRGRGWTVAVAAVLAAAAILAALWLVPALPEPNSQGAEAVDALFYVVLAAVGALFLLTEAFLVWSLIRPSAQPRRRHALELAWTFVPGLILVSLAIFGGGALGSAPAATEATADSGAVVIQVLAKRFEWHFRYPDAEGRFGTPGNVTRRSQLHLPVDRKVILRLQAADVLHGFWLPNARIRQDLVPGATVTRSFTINRPGHYEIICAQLCGIGHSRMRGVLVAQEMAEYEAWLKKTRSAQQAYGGHDPSDDEAWKLWKD
ncbi:MAG: cytochrome c oxidase subunit II [Planctomycetota bacterium]|jgi:cytochrome c oxidase subunit 2